MIRWFYFEYSFIQILQVDVWPFQCVHASILKFAGRYEFNTMIYDCCSKCSFPAFTACARNRKRKNLPDWMCPSEGLHCIVGCVNKHKPVVRIKTVGTRVKTVETGVKPEEHSRQKVLWRNVKKPVLGRCEKVDSENGNQCIRKVCVPLKLKP